MGLKSIKSILAEAGLANAEQFVNWSKAWRAAVEGGSQESLLGFFSREAGMAEDIFLQKLSAILGWPYLDLPKLVVTAEAQSEPEPPDGPAEQRPENADRHRPQERRDGGLDARWHGGQGEREGAESRPGVHPHEDEGADAGGEQARQRHEAEGRPGDASRLHDEEGTQQG